ncbi:unnamed protein product [Trichobilharzia szidati]|nr:unnamed protein product [Trichobilharzia szidati]
MATPLPPADTEQQNIIDKLAEFVARNGPEFEALTSEKQRDNPKFAFLRGGEYREYYLYRVNEALKVWQQQYSMKDKSLQPFDRRNNWVNMNDQWDQYSGSAEHWQRYSAPPQGHCGWGGPDPTWYPKPQWPYPQGIRMPGCPPAFPFHPPPNAMDSYHHGNFNNPPQYGYPGQHGAFPPQQYSFGPESYHASGSYEYQVSNSSELGEADIEQSEKNLAAQHESLLARQEVEIHELLDKKREENVRKAGEKLNMSWEQMNEMIQPLIEACTKENISKGKSWIVDKMTESPELTKLMSDYLIARASATRVSFDLRLHLVYLLNDLLHHSKRRGAPAHLQEALQETVPIIFCLATEIADEEQKAKINRVLSLWETNSYLPAEVLVKMRPPESSKFLTEWKESQSKPYEVEIDKIKSNIKNQYTSLERQHQEFADHVRRQLASSHSDKSDESRSDNHHSQYGSSHHSMQSVDPNFAYWGPPPPSQGSTGYDMSSQEMMNSSDMRDMQRRMPSYPPPHMPGYTGNAGAGGVPGGPGYPPQMGWAPPGQRDSSKWNQSMPNYNTQSGHRNHELSSNVYIEGEEPDDEQQSQYSASSYDCTSYSGYYNNNNTVNNDYRQYEESNRSGRDGRDSQSNRDGKSRTSRGNRPSRFSSAPSQSETCTEKKADTSESVKSATSTEENKTPMTDTEDSKDIETSSTQVVEAYDINEKYPAWQLPAGLMHSLIKLKDFDFTPISESDLQLLPANTPSERLLIALENFYMPPTPDRPRDGEGWEHLALNEFYAKKERARPVEQKEKDEKDNISTGKGKSNRRRQNSGSSYASSHSDLDFTSGFASDQRDCTVDVDKPFSRDSTNGEVSLGPPQLAYITAYPKAAVGQPLRTGNEALTLAPPPMQCMQGQLTHNYSAYKATGVHPGIPIPVPPMAGLLGTIPPGPGAFPNTSFLQFPPPVNQPPPALPIPQGLIQRPPPGFSADRFESRRSRSRSRSDSRSKSASRSRSRDFHSRSGSRSDSRSSRSRSRSRSDSRDSRSKSGSPRRDDESSSNQSRGFSRSRRRNRSRSRSSSSPMARFTSAPGPGGITPGSSGSGSGSSNMNAARAAAIAAAVSIANSINAQSGWSNNNNNNINTTAVAANNNNNNVPISTFNNQGFNGPALLPGGPFADSNRISYYPSGYQSNQNQGQQNRGVGALRGGFSLSGMPGRGGGGVGGGMRYHGSDDRFYPPQRDHQRR